MHSCASHSHASVYAMAAGPASCNPGKNNKDRRHVNKAPFLPNAHRGGQFQTSCNSLMQQAVPALLQLL